MSRHDDMTPPPPRDLLTFSPVPTGRMTARAWTAEVQRAFILSLAYTACVSKAAKSVGRSARSAYALRDRAGSQSQFAHAWDRAIEHGSSAAYQRTLEKLRSPDRVPVMWRGKVVAWNPRNDDNLLIAAIRVIHARQDGITPAHRERLERAERYREQCAEAARRLGPVDWGPPTERAYARDRAYFAKRGK